MIRWERWGNTIAEWGPRLGYNQIYKDYPPLASQCLGLATQLGSLFHWNPLFSIKVSLLVVFWLMIAVFWLATRNFWATILACASLLIHGASHGHLDTYYGPILVAAFAAFSSRRYLIFAVLFTVACFVKWEPIIAAPFFLLHVIREQPKGTSLSSKVKSMALQVLGPAAFVCLLVVILFGWKPLFHAIGLAFNSQPSWAVSSNAFNLPWIISHFLEWWSPGHFGGLEGGAGQVLQATSAAWMETLCRLPFVSVCALLVWVLWQGPVSTARTLLACLVGYLSHFTLSPGVHEGDLFPAVLLALYLFATKRLNWTIAVSIAVLMNANILCVHDLDGKGLRFDRVIAGNFDTALGMAMVEVTVYFMILAAFVRQFREESTSTADRSRRANSLVMDQPSGWMKCAAFLVLIMPGVLLLNADGRPDIGFFWEKWSGLIVQWGPVEGYRQIWTDYPPLASQFLGLAVGCGAHLGLDAVLSIKVSLLVALWVTTGVFWKVTQHFGATLLTHSALLLSSVAHAYLDIYYAPFFIGALAALSHKRHTTFAILYTLSLLVKWQPIVIAPFLFLHLLRTYAPPGSVLQGMKRMTWQVLAPTAAMATGVTLIFGPAPLIHALALTFGGAMHKYWSIMGLNLPWCVSHIIELLHSGNFVGYWGKVVSMENGEGVILPLPTDSIQPLTRLPFALSYLFCLYTVWKNRVSIVRTLMGCTMGYIAYFLLNTGVHENHLVPALLCGLYLFGLAELDLATVICLALVVNGNILIFNGLEGGGPRFDRALGGVLDVAFCMAIANVLVLGLILVQLARRVGANNRLIRRTELQPQPISA